MLVLVRFGPRYSKFCWSWSGPVQNFLKICWFWSGSVLDFQAIYWNRIRFGSKIALFPETAFDANAELDQTSVIYWNRIRSKCWFGSQFRYLLKPYRFQRRKKVKIRLFPETASISNTELGQNQAFSETASVTNAELGHNWAIFLNRILFKCVNGSKSVNSPILTSVHIYNGCDFSKKPDFDPFPHLK